MTDIEELRANLLGSVIGFTQTFYPLRTGRDFELSQPVSRESHFLTISRALKRVVNGETKRLIINVPPRYGKTEELIHFIAYCLARYPDSNFIYTSYSSSLATKQTQTVRSIMSLPYYRKVFGVELSDTTSAKGDFETNFGGSVYACGAGGTITGRGAGIQNCDRFSGAIIIDDIHKPDEVTSDTIREGIIDWYYNTLQSRINSPNTPIIFIGQRLHELDLAAHLIESGEWETVIIPALDKHNNVLHPTMHDLPALLAMKEKNPYVFAAQYQQDPQPSGGGIFKPEWFYLTDEEPPVIATFITADTAETDKDYNDATVFSFWGLYQTPETNDLALHWIDCREIRVEPKDLRREFMDFYVDCCRYPVKPKMAAIEKKSSGTTLVSVLSEVQGFQIRPIERTKASGNKTARFLEAQPYVASHLISLPRYGKHTDMCITHMKKITANDTHAHDDIADTLYDAVKIALIDKYLSNTPLIDIKESKLMGAIISKTNRLAQLRSARR